MHQGFNPADGPGRVTLWPRSGSGRSWASSRPIVRDTSKQHVPATDLLRICKASLPHEAKDSILGVFFQVVAGMEQVGQEAMCSVLRPFEIEHVKFAARFEDAPHRTQHLPPLVRGEVVEHERREHVVE